MTLELLDKGRKLTESSVTGLKLAWDCKDAQCFSGMPQ